MGNPKDKKVFETKTEKIRKMSDTLTSMKSVTVTSTKSSAKNPKKSSFLGVNWNRSAMSRISPHGSPKASPKPSPCNSPALQRKAITNPQSSPSPAMRKALAAKKK